MNGMIKAIAGTLVVVSMLLSSSCSLLSRPMPTLDDVVGAWKSDRLEATLVLRSDMTFDIENVPAGYAYINVPSNADPNELMTFSGTWELNRDEKLASSPSIVLLFDKFGPGSYKYVDMRFLGSELEKLNLTQGDPDGGDFLRFSLEK